MRKKISISIDADLLKRLNRLIDGAFVRNTSQAFEYVLDDYFRMFSVKTAIILLGKDGQNFSRSNLLSTLRRLGSSGISKIFIAAGRNSEKIFSMLGQRFEGVEIDYFEEKKLLGTAGVVHALRKLITGPFLVLSGDVEFDFALEDFIESHSMKHALVSMAVTAVPKRDSTDKLTLEGDTITSFKYKSKERTNLTDSGIYVFDAKIFRYLLEKGSLAKDVFPRLAKEGLIRGYVFNKKWKHL